MPIPHASIRAAVPHSHPVPHAVRGAIWIPAIWFWLRRGRARLLWVCADTAQRACVRSNNTIQSLDCQDTPHSVRLFPKNKISQVQYSKVATAQKHMRSEAPVAVAVAESSLLVHRSVQV